LGYIEPNRLAQPLVPNAKASAKDVDGRDKPGHGAKQRDAVLRLIHRLDIGGLGELDRGRDVVFDELAELIDAHLLRLDA
jgi:hypothetical protein